MKGVKTVVNPTWGLVSSIQAVTPKAKFYHGRDCTPISMCLSVFPLGFLFSQVGSCGFVLANGMWMGLITALPGLAHPIAFIIFHAETLCCCHSWKQRTWDGRAQCKEPGSLSSSLRGNLSGRVVWQEPSHRTLCEWEINLCVKSVKFQHLFVTTAESNLPWLTHLSTHYYPQESSLYLSYTWRFKKST